jgi:hypothetical protein
MAYLNNLLFVAVGRVYLVEDQLEDVVFCCFIHLETDLLAASEHILSNRLALALYHKQIFARCSLL